MANGSSFASLSLDRRAKRGRVGTAGGDMPAPAGAIGAVDDPTDHSEPTSADIETLSASDLEFLAGGSALTPPAHVIAAAEAAEPVESKPRVAHIPGSAFAGLSVLASTRSIP